MIIADIAYIMDMTYSHVIKIVNKLIAKGLLKKQSKGREMIITLTENGAMVKIHLNSLIRYFV